MKKGPTKTEVINKKTKQKVKADYLTQEINESLANSNLPEELQLEIYTSLTDELANSIIHNKKFPIHIRRGAKAFFRGYQNKDGLELGTETDREVMLDGCRMHQRLTQIVEGRENNRIRVAEYRLREKEAEVSMRLKEKEMELKDAQIKVLNIKDPDKLDNRILLELAEMPEKILKKQQKNPEVHSL